MDSKLARLLDQNSSHTDQTILNFDDYLNLIKVEPWVTRDSPQLLHDMLLSSGVEHSIVPGQASHSPV